MSVSSFTGVFYRLTLLFLLQIDKGKLISVFSLNQAVVCLGQGLATCGFGATCGSLVLMLRLFVTSRK